MLLFFLFSSKNIAFYKITRRYFFKKIFDEIIWIKWIYHKARERENVFALIICCSFCRKNSYKENTLEIKSLIGFEGINYESPEN